MSEYPQFRQTDDLQSGPSHSSVCTVSTRRGEDTTPRPGPALSRMRAVGHGNIDVLVGFSSASRSSPRVKEVIEVGIPSGRPLEAHMLR